uniref:Uncharacterized protein n=1 Tax=Candidatus Kentrum sp. LPFa TaxID=2126335 RepID=A0A450VS69_9GAMM|nr:MAG: hypothetical protein BECKLPF1236A_GA0070988_1001016 [Candidatus Kentron sp. LPFa]VFK23806.1 MAG: hypothetical protein BECKLPF1236C_GA0070990_100083 [Candidatus Kentron sp. LPFa]
MIRGRVSDKRRFRENRCRRNSLFRFGPIATRQQIKDGSDSVFSALPIHKEKYQKNCHFDRREKSCAFGISSEIRRFLAPLEMTYFKVSEKQKFRKNRCLCKEHSVWILARSANMFTALAFGCGAGLASDQQKKRYRGRHHETDRGWARYQHGSRPQHQIGAFH